jgi:hypothetical protein
VPPPGRRTITGPVTRRARAGPAGQALQPALGPARRCHRGGDLPAIRPPSQRQIRGPAGSGSGPATDSRPGTVSPARGTRLRLTVTVTVTVTVTAPSHGPCGPGSAAGLQVQSRCQVEVSWPSGTACGFTTSYKLTGFNLISARKPSS